MNKVKVKVWRWSKERRIEDWYEGRKEYWGWEYEVWKKWEESWKGREENEVVKRG